MIKALSAFGIAFFIAGLFIYPRPTLFFGLLLFCFVVIFAGSFDDPEDKDDKNQE